MELSKGRSLYEEIKRNNAQPFDEIICRSIIRDLLEGVKYCSDNKIMHRDLKPENLIFAEDKNLK